MMVDRDIHLARALLVDGNTMLRSTTATQLRDAGVGQVSTAGRIRDARLMLEQEHFDIVVCTREFEDSKESGQDLLDELRRENLLPQSTVFLMVSNQVAYHQVVEAAEAALDGLLVRPFTAATLAQKLQEARLRKRELADVLKALDAGETQLAFAHAIKRFQAGLPFGTYCGRLAAELLIGMGRVDDARRLFEKLFERTQSTWALLGKARAELGGGDKNAASRTLTEVLKKDPQAADAHDLMGQILVERGDFNAALDQYLAAAKLTPGCLLRAQSAGSLAFFQGQRVSARLWLERTLAMGMQSKLFDELTLILIAFLRFEDKDIVGVATLHRQLRQLSGSSPESTRLRRLEAVAQVLSLAVSGNDAQSEQALTLLSQQIGADDFDLEAANLVLALWTRTRAAAAGSSDHLAVLEAVGMRFCTNRAVAEVLMAAAGRSEATDTVVRQCQGRVMELSESAMAKAMDGKAVLALPELLAEAERTLNSKLLELVVLIAKRHQQTAPELEVLAAKAAAIQLRCGKASGHIAGLQRNGGRSAGALQLRGKAAQEVKAELLV